MDINKLVNTKVCKWCDHLINDKTLGDVKSRRYTDTEELCYDCYLLNECSMARNKFWDILISELIVWEDDCKLLAEGFIDEPDVMAAAEHVCDLREIFQGVFNEDDKSIGKNFKDRLDKAHAYAWPESERYSD